MEMNTPTTYQVTISKEELSELPLAVYDGNVILVDNREDMLSAIQKIKQSPVIGFDTETKPSFRRGAYNKVSLLQLSSYTNCYLFRLNKIGFPAELVELLEDANITKIGLSIRDDFFNLNKIRKIRPAGFVDLQQYVKQCKIADNSLQRIYAILFGERISKSQRMTNWEADTLTPSQMNYAAMDAISCVKIYNFINEGRFIPESSPYYKKIDILDEQIQKTE